MGELDLDLTLSSKIPAKLARITIELTAKTSSGDKALCVQIKTAPENLIADGENLIAELSSAEDVQRSSWPHPSSSAPNKTVTTYHLFQRKYTGLANKDAGDFTGDASFIFMTFNPFEAGNPESSMQHNIIEMSTVSVEDWSTEYLKCNAPGAVYSGHGQGLDCPSSNIDYCCTGNRSALTAETLLRMRHMVEAIGFPSQRQVKARSGQKSFSAGSTAHALAMLGGKRQGVVRSVELISINALPHASSLLWSRVQTIGLIKQTT